MTIDLKWLLPVAVCFVAWGMWGFLPKYALRYLTPADALLYEIAGAVVVGIGVFIWAGCRVTLHPVGAAYAVSAGLFNYLGILCYLYAIRSGPVSVISATTALYPVCTVIMAYGLLHETISLSQLAGIILALVSVVLMALG